MYMIVNIIPFIISFFDDLSGTPTSIDTRIPPTKPPIWAALSIPDDRNPITRFAIITGNTELFIVAPRYVR